MYSTKIIENRFKTVYKEKTFSSSFNKYQFRYNNYNDTLYGLLA